MNTTNITNMTNIINNLYEGIKNNPIKRDVMTAFKEVLAAGGFNLKSPVWDDAKMDFGGWKVEMPITQKQTQPSFSRGTTFSKRKIYNKYLKEYITYDEKAKLREWVKTCYWDELEFPPNAPITCLLDGRAFSWQCKGMKHPTLNTGIPGVTSMAAYIEKNFPKRQGAGKTTTHFECDGENIWTRILKVGLRKIRSGEYNPTYKPRRAAFTFDMVDYKQGKTIWFKYDKRFSCKVVDSTHVEFAGRRDWTLHELSKALYAQLGATNQHSFGSDAWVDENGVVLTTVRKNYERTNGKICAERSLKLANNIGQM